MSQAVVITDENRSSLLSVAVAGVAKLAAELSFEQGATLPFVGLTGRQAVDGLVLSRLEKRSLWPAR
jgi:NADPH:quinone reductase-like Zn-dependent oxidoreductase